MIFMVKGARNYDFHTPGGPLKSLASAELQPYQISLPQATVRGLDCTRPLRHIFSAQSLPCGGSPADSQHCVEGLCASDCALLAHVMLLFET